MVGGRGGVVPSLFSTVQHRQSKWIASSSGSLFKNGNLGTRLANWVGAACLSLFSMVSHYVRVLWVLAYHTPMLLPFQLAEHIWTLASSTIVQPPQPFKHRLQTYGATPEEVGHKKSNLGAG